MLQRVSSRRWKRATLCSVFPLATRCVQIMRHDACRWRRSSAHPGIWPMWWDPRPSKPTFSQLGTMRYPIADLCGHESLVFEGSLSLSRLLKISSFATLKSRLKTKLYKFAVKNFSCILVFLCVYRFLSSHFRALSPSVFLKCFWWQLWEALYKSSLTLLVDWCYSGGLKLSDNNWHGNGHVVY
jgi:hypothetical protein